MADIHFNDVINPLLRAYNRLMYVNNLLENNCSLEVYMEGISTNGRGEMEIVHQFIMSNGQEYTRKIVQGEYLENTKVVDWIDL